MTSSALPDLHQGTTPLLISMPHVGTRIPAALQAAYVDRALDVEDTDWHLERLYAFAHEIGASMLVPSISRYVIDLNRPPDDTPMYPGASNTELCPTRFFTGDPLYLPGMAPDAQAIEHRKTAYWQPYHQALQNELARIKAAHGFALLWDAHSIRSEIPWLFEGRLPDLNIGTANGASADARITEAVAQAAAGLGSGSDKGTGFSIVVNGRFRGGYITRRYGQPHAGIHAVQLEMCQCTYMQEASPFGFESAPAARVQPVLKGMLSAALAGARAIHA